MTPFALKTSLLTSYPIIWVTALIVGHYSYVQTIDNVILKNSRTQKIHNNTGDKF